MVLLIAATAFATERTYDKEFQVSAGAQLSLDCHKGTIQIRTHAQPVIQVYARIYPDQGQDPALEDLLEIRERSGAAYVSLEVEYGDSGSIGRGLLGKSTTLPLVDFEIMVPDDAALELDSHKATFDVEAGSGPVTVDSHKGGGTIRGVRGDFRLDTHKGRFGVEVEELAGIEVDTHKGEVEVAILSAGDFSIRGESHDGTLRFEGRDVEVVRDDHDVRVDYSEGSGQNRIVLSTHDGTITFRFVD